jgi:hypothetical protein
VTCILLLVSTFSKGSAFNNHSHYVSQLLPLVLRFFIYSHAEVFPFLPGELAENEDFQLHTFPLAQGDASAMIL